MHGPLMKSRLTAAGLHILGSILVAGLAAALVFGLWYPSPYRTVSGGAELFLLLVSVDVIMGPLITLAVFDVRKPRRELVRDMCVVVMLQLAALGYGLYTVHLARPVALVLEVDRYRVVPAVAVVESELPLAPPPLRTLSWTGPRLLRIEMPHGEEKAEATMMGLAGVDLGMRPKYWRAWDDEARKQALKAGTPLADLLKKHPQDQAVGEEAARAAGRPVGDLLVIPMLARRSDWSVLVDRSTGDPVGFVPLDGF